MSEASVVKCPNNKCVKEHIVTDTHSGELVCGDCGLVLAEKFNYQDYNSAHDLEDYETKSRTGIRLSLAISKWGCQL